MRKYKLWNRRLTALLLAAAMTGALVSGCGSKTADSTETTTEAAESVQETSGENAQETSGEAAAEAESDGAAETGSADEAAEETPDYTTGTPWMDSNIDGNVTADTEVNLKDDFYLAVNKDRILEFTYQPGYNSESTLEQPAKAVEENQMALITDESFTSREAEQLRDYYHALDDWETREPLAKELVQEHLDVIDGIKTVKDYQDAVRVWCDMHSLNSWGLFEFGLDVASDDSTTYIGTLMGPDLTLQDAAEYKERTQSGEIDYEINKRIYEYGCELMGLDKEEADREYDRMIDFEAKIAEHTMTQEEQMRADAIVKMDNYAAIDELDQILGDGYDLRAELEENGFLPERVKISMPEQIEFFGELLSDESNLEDLKNWMKVHCVIDSTSDLSKEAMIHVEEIMQEVRGTQEIKEYEKMLLSQTDQDLSAFMQQAYVDRYASPEMKEQIASLCKDIAAEYRQMLQEEEWLSQETRDKAAEKLDALTINAVYPDKWEDYSGLDISGMNYYDALQAVRKFGLQLACSELNHKVDPEIWQVNPLEANAYYNPVDNSINILLGILGEEIYTADMSREEVYGRIGAAIGHEISHAFDSMGSQYDKDGNMTDWWTEEDSAAFEERVQKVRDYYDHIAIYGDKYLVGAKLDGEATADIAGFQCILRLAEKEEDFDYDTLFRSYAALWCCKETPYAADYLYIYDPHPPEYLRGNVTLQQFDEFLETYDIQEGDGMYLAPEDRIKVW